MHMTELFLDNEKSATELIKTFDNFFCGLKISDLECETAGIGVKKRVKIALCGIECVHVTENVIKIFYNYLFYYI